MKAIVITPEGTVEKTMLQSDTDGSYLKVLQNLVGGWIEFTSTLDPTVEMIVNEEGLIHGLEYNLLASQTAGQHIVGTAVLVQAGSFD